MATKRSTSKSSSARTNKNGSTARKSSSRSTAQRKPATQRKPWFTPQQQREFFALALIGLGLLLLVLLWSSGATDRGVVGAGVVELIQRAFGNSGFLVPIMFVVVGGLILWQER